MAVEAHHVAIPGEHPRRNSVGNEELLLIINCRCSVRLLAPW